MPTSVTLFLVEYSSLGELTILGQSYKRLNNRSSHVADLAHGLTQLGQTAKVSYE